MRLNLSRKIISLVVVLTVLILAFPTLGVHAAGTLVTLTSATASSSLSGLGPDKLIDGIVNSNPNIWSSAAHTSKANTEWAAVFFNTTTVNKIVLYMNSYAHQCFPSDFRLQYTTDSGASWIDIPGMYFQNFNVFESDVTSNGGVPKSSNSVNGTVPLSFEELSANGIRVYAEGLTPDTSGNYYFQLGEFQVYSPQYLDRTKFVTAVSSQYNDLNLQKDKLTDGQYSGFWSSAVVTQTTEVTMDVTFPMQEVKGVNLYARNESGINYGFPVDFDIEYTNDTGATWRKLPNMDFLSYPTNNIQLQRFRFSGVIANGLRVRAKKLTQDPAGNYVFQLSEVSIPNLETKLISEVKPQSAFVVPSNEVYSTLTPDKMIDNVIGTGIFYSSLSKSGADISTSPISIGTKFATYKSINRVELYPRRQNNINYGFPARFEVNYSTDGGTTWYTIPTQVYTTTDFNTNNASVVRLQFGDVVANAIRVKVYKLTQDPGGFYFLQMDEIKVYGYNYTTPFMISSGASGGNYPTAADTQKFADINNFYSIFGMGSLTPKDAYTPGPDYLLGGRMRWNEVATGTEMFFSGSKLFWNNNYDLNLFKYELEEVPLDYITNTDSYVWATETNRKHLQSNLHFNNNATYIIDAANYLNWTGDTSLFDQRPTDRSFYYKNATQNDIYFAPDGRMVYVGLGAYVGQTFHPTHDFTAVGMYLYTPYVNNTSTRSVTLSLYKIVPGADDTLMASTTISFASTSCTGWSWRELTFPDITDLSSDYHIVVQNSTLGATDFWATPLAVWAQNGDMYASGYGTIAGTINGAIDVDKMNDTLMTKLQKAMAWQLNTMKGSVGGVGKIFKITNDASIPATSEYQYSGGAPVSGITVTADSKPCNYWDLVRSGYEDPWSNVHYYRSLLGLANIYAAKGDTANRDLYNNLAGQVKTDFNTVFWNVATGRYVSWIDKLGNVRDYGSTYVNLEAVSAGLSDSAKTNSIIDWITGARTVVGDTVTGTGIYFGSQAPRVNTKDLKDANNLWWSPDNHFNWRSDGLGRGDFGNEEEQGGTDLYLSYYDIMDRLQKNGASDAWTRFDNMITDFHTDEWFRPQTPDPYPDPNYPTITRYQNVNYTIPESGLAAAAMVNGFVGIKGIDPAAGLLIYPNISTGYSYMVADDIRYKDRVIRVTSEAGGLGVTIEVKANVSAVTTSMTGKVGNLLANHSYVISNISGDGTNVAPVITTTNVMSNASGEVTFTQTIGTGDIIIKIQ